MITDDQPYYSWSYWVDDKGLEEAAEVYYYETFNSDSELRRYYQQYKDAIKLIEMRMEQLADKEDGDGDV